jgi:hypothetical protein
VLPQKKHFRPRVWTCFGFGLLPILKVSEGVFSFEQLTKSRESDSWQRRSNRLPKVRIPSTVYCTLSEDER